MAFQTIPSALFTEPIVEHSLNQNIKYELNSDIVQYLNFTDDVTNISRHNAECGRIWLYHEKGLILSIDSISNNTIYIKNISPYISHCNASRISIYVTIHGIELLGGLAIAHTTKCEWYYTFYITISGEYKIMARLLYYDGDLDVDYKQCNISYNTLLYNEETTMVDIDGVYHDDKYIFNRISSTIKFYAEYESCCEWCTRNKNCIYFISDDMEMEGYGNKITTLQQNRCILFNHTAINNMKTINVEEMRNKFINLNTTKWIFGYKRREKTKHYLGSLIATTPTQIKCTHNLHRDMKEYDVIYNSKQYVTLNRNFIREQQNNYKRFCSFNNIQNFDGQWIVINIDNRPRFRGQPKHYEFNKCGIDDFYCDVPAFFAPFHCQWRYNNTLQILRDLYIIKGIKRITFSGDSIMVNTINAFKMLFNQQLFQCNAGFNASLQSPLLCFVGGDIEKNGRNKRNGREEIFISNFRLIHELWHNRIDEIEQYMNEIGIEYNNYFILEYGNDTTNWPMMIVFELPLIISEREYHCTAPRTMKVNKLIHDILKEKWGWNVFPLFKLTQAMQYDYTWIQDGMHGDGFVLTERVRVLFELIFNTIS